MNFYLQCTRLCVSRTGVFSQMQVKWSFEVLNLRNPVIVIRGIESCIEPNPVVIRVSI